MNVRSDLAMAYNMGYEDALAKRMPNATKAGVLNSLNCSNNCTNGERTETCEMEYVSDWMSWHCKSCDHMDMAPRNPKPRYCKWCGRKVVEPTKNDVDAEVEQ